MLHVVKDVSFLSHVTSPSRETNFLHMKQVTDMKNRLYAQLIEVRSYQKRCEGLLRMLHALDMFHFFHVKHILEVKEAYRHE